jgi:hypothetical protein
MDLERDKPPFATEFIFEFFLCQLELILALDTDSWAQESEISGEITDQWEDGRQIY